MMRGAPVIVALAACGGGGSAPDGRPDATADATVDATQPCTGSQAFTGELIDFDSSPTNFLGVVDAVFTLRSDPGCTATTAPNGRFILSIPIASEIFDVVAPGDYLPGIWPIDGGLSSSATYSERALTAADLAALGVTLDPTRAQVLVNQKGNEPLPLTVSGAQDATFTTDDGTSWAPGNDQRYILFTNVEIGTGLVEVIDQMAITVPAGEPRVEAGKVTYLTTFQLPE